MRLTISARHMVLDPALHQRAVEVLDRLGRLWERVHEGTALFDRVAGMPWVEFRLRCSGGVTLVATATSDDHRTALDVVERKIRRQVHRVHRRPAALRHALAT